MRVCVLAFAVLAAIGLADNECPDPETRAREEAGFLSEENSMAKPKLVPEHKLRDAPGITPSPTNVMPGITSELTKGFDITSGDPYNTISHQIFVWTYDFGMKQNWNGRSFDIPDQLAIFLKNVCLISELNESTMSSTFTESMESQGSSWSGGFDEKVDIGLEYKGMGIGSQIQNTMMFGESSISTEYSSQFHQERTMTMTTSSKAEAFNSKLYEDHIKHDWFHPYFVLAVEEFVDEPTREHAFDFFDDYGTHFIQEAELGGLATRNVYFSETIDQQAAQDYFHEESESTIGWLWFGGSKSDSSTDTTPSSSGHEGSVYMSATTIYGGDPKAETPGEFCASLEKYQTPRVLEFKKLIPIYEIFDSVDTIPKGSGALMKKHVDKFWEDGANCAVTTCGGQISMCTWRSSTRSWGVPCNCLSRAGRVEKRADVTDVEVKFHREQGAIGRKMVYASFAGWTFRKSSRKDDHGVTHENYEIDMAGDCFVWDDGKSGRVAKPDNEHGGYYQSVEVWATIPPHTRMIICFHDECDGGGTYIYNMSDEAKFWYHRSNAGSYGAKSKWVLEVMSEHV